MKTVKKTLTKPSKERCRYTFTPEELQALGKELSERNIELAGIQNDKKRVMSDLTAQIKGAESNISIAANKLQSGYEWRDLPCTIHFNLPTPGRKSIIRDDNHETIAVKDMTQDELQAELALPEE